MALAVYQPTSSQYAAAATHLEHQIEHVRIDGTRYAIVTSGTSGRVYWLPAAGTSCPCIWWTQTRTTCSHLLALELSALEDDLLEGYTVGSASLKAMRAAYRGCAAGCGNVVEQSNLLWCDNCGAARERAAERQERNRALCEKLGI